MKGLTERGKEILQLLALGWSTSSIAKKLLISEKTVRKHLEHIYRKLKIHSHIEAVAWAWREGLVKGQPPSFMNCSSKTGGAIGNEDKKPNRRS
ncbi:MAG: LuxR C-terminal-related transcriptional regulator [Caldiserica bacterium]|jgi:DNA-binding CsgD family transcriptional regulator|nr:LuxR C-terminal-related transcriptional regulator [Caldisericota bacterium]